MKAYPRLSCLAILLSLTLLSGLGASAQESAVPAENPATVAQTEKSVSNSAETDDKEKKQIEQERQLKESAVVKKLAHALGVSPAQAYWGSVILNFAIIAGLIIFALKSHLPAVFRERTSLIKKGMEDARRASAESSARLTDIESRLSRLDAEIAEMRSQAERDSSAEDQRLNAATEAEKRKIVESSEQEIVAAANQVRRDLKQFAAELAVSLAEKRISVSETADKALVRDFSTHLDAPQSQKGGN